MRTTAYAPEQIIKIIEQAEKGEQRIAAICCEHGIAENTFYRWRKAYRGMSVNEVQRHKELEKENSQLKRLLAERVLEIALLKVLRQKRPDRDRAARGGHLFAGRWAVGTTRLRADTHPALDVSLRCSAEG